MAGDLLQDAPVAGEVAEILADARSESWIGMRGGRGSGRAPSRRAARRPHDARAPLMHASRAAATQRLRIVPMPSIVLTISSPGCR